MISRKMEESLLRRIGQMVPVLQKNAATSGHEREPSSEERSSFQECFAGTVSLGKSVYGAESLQMRELLNATERLHQVNPYPGVMDSSLAQILIGFLTNLRTEIENGLLVDLADRAASEVLGDFLFLADKAFEAGQKDVAAVLGSAALEDALKRKAQQLGLDVADEELSSVVNAMKSKSFFEGAEVKIVSSFVRLRNSAMHAQWEKITGPDVGSLIGYLKTFLVQRM